MSKGEIKKYGIVTEGLPDARFRVELEDGKSIIAYMAGRLKIHKIKILPGDAVTVEFSPYDENRGRIVYRGKR
ncbi:MAG: translation initiation factor IF-1 [bacterium]|nr:translation initiation factor IF-1 [bacterium]